MSPTVHRILVPTDGSAHAERALAYAIGLVKAMPGAELHLLNIQPPVTGMAGTLVGHQTLKDYHREEAMKVLQAPLAAAAAAGVAAKHHIGVGQPGPTIAGFAKELGCAQIVMGSRGLGATIGMILGSVATDVLHHAEVPVTLVK